MGCNQKPLVLTESPEAQANLDWLKSQKYPLLVGDLPAILPEATNG
ncbi:hypothetical protein Oscil6304_0436 [Oscillatoria acuminata PCC 6304]|uniref:Uncharacterized protein n=1 Tax=Oscillatoria acuminata PCC 6304 TaxID=56110 RepID=K9TCC3_9CYAN|nr:hypothetical protein Oscil6304_0436 [Oscillatoria acuminata PCC 6304]